jgi:hypothetical protein
MAKKSGDVHVSSKEGGGWKVTQDRAVISNHRTQANAIDRAKTEARKDGVDAVTHGRDGRIRSKDSFGNDPVWVRDTEH